MDYQHDGVFLEDKYFILMYGDQPHGDIKDREGSHNEWLSLEELQQKDKVFAAVPEITALALSGEPGFVEKQHHYDRSEY